MEPPWVLQMMGDMVAAMLLNDYQDFTMLCCTCLNLQSGSGDVFLWVTCVDDDANDAYHDN
eukprot:4183056-Karenia_brevis.AAC.1